MRKLRRARQKWKNDQVVGGRGCGFPDLGKDLHGSGPGSFSVWVRDVGDDTTYWEGFERIPPQGGPQFGGMATIERD